MRLVWLYLVGGTLVLVAGGWLITEVTLCLGL